MYSFVPFVLLFVINIMLIRVLRRKTRHLPLSISIAKKNQLSINVSVIVMTLLFIVFTCPSAIVSHFYNTLIASYNGKVIMFTCGNIALSYHALNIVIMCVMNKFFFRKLKEAFKCSTLKQNESSNIKTDVPILNNNTENQNAQ